jgi:hypothetical protein
MCPREWRENGGEEFYSKGNTEQSLIVVVGGGVCVPRRKKHMRSR